MSIVVISDEVGRQIKKALKHLNEKADLQLSEGEKNYMALSDELNTIAMRQEAFQARQDVALANIAEDLRRIKDAAGVPDEVKARLEAVASKMDAFTAGVEALAAENPDPAA